MYRKSLEGNIMTSRIEEDGKKMHQNINVNSIFVSFYFPIFSRPLKLYLLYSFVLRVLDPVLSPVLFLSSPRPIAHNNLNHDGHLIQVEQIGFSLLGIQNWEFGKIKSVCMHALGLRDRKLCSGGAGIFPHQHKESTFA